MDLQLLVKDMTWLNVYIMTAWIYLLLQLFYPHPQFFIHLFIFPGRGKSPD